MPQVRDDTAQPNGPAHPHQAHPSLAGRSVLITGGARGLGKAMTLALVGAGCHVFVIARSEHEIDATTTQANALGPGLCRGVPADISVRADCRHAISAAEREFGKVDVLVNNAAVGPPPDPTAATPGTSRPFWHMDHETIQHMVAVNLLGACSMFQLAVPGMLTRNFGRIINISTSRPTMRRPRTGPYGPIKAALEATTHIWATELDGTGVTANALLPGGVSDTALVGGTNIGRRAAPFAAGKGPLGEEGQSMPMLPPHIMGPPILWLASDASNDTTGRRIVARDWDPDLTPAAAARRATQEPATSPVIM